MLFKGSIKSDKTNLLAKKYAELINSGINSSKILVLCQNSTKKNMFLDFAKKYLEKPCFELNVFSFFGLTRNFMEKFWPIIENTIPVGNAVVEPNLGGLEISEYIFKKCINEIEFKGYNSKNSLLHQIFRRYALICENNLNQEDIREREKILNEGFSKNIKEAISLYKNKTLELRSFDYLRQSEAFNFLHKKIKNNFEYVLIDDGDELTPLAIDYLKYIKDDVKDFYINFDDKGASRKGYLCASNEDFEKLFQEKAKELDEDTSFEDKIFDTIKNEEKIENEKITVKDFIKREDMALCVVKNINQLLKKGIKPSEISIITPDIDSILKFYFEKIDSKVFYLTGSSKLSSNPFISCLLLILKYINGLKAEFSYRILRKILRDILNIDFKTSNEIADLCYSTQKFEMHENEKYLEFLHVLDLVKKEKLSNQLFIICDNFIELNCKNQKDITKVNELLKQITDFEDVLGETLAKKYLLEAFDYTIISENPIKSEEIDKDSIVVGTAQKIIDNEVKTKYQFLLDATSENWIRQDIGPLYNAWVYQKKWNKNKFTFEDNKKLTLDKCARTLRKLFLLNSKKTSIYSSNYNFKGQENVIGGISKFFKTENINSKKPKNIIPRDDQKPVLEYKRGKMGVNAVAGSGKTTIMLALVVKLLSSGINPENIFVLTYMDSAAKNFKERIKSYFPNLSELPHISTIHALALRIIKENGNHRYLGLDEDFEIADEVQVQNIMGEILGEEKKRTNTYLKAIENFKMEDGCTFKSLNFKNVYETYSKYLNENNLLDYSDILIFALKLLQENNEIREYYQNLAQYILEDEAQDSNSIQKKIIEILSAKNGNVVRVGDVNQSIMTTFSNSDVKGFKEFVTKNNYVNMNKSERCSKGVYSLANKLIKYARKNNVDAFIDVEMMPVENKNPKDNQEVVCKIFEQENDERKFIAKEIENIFKENKDASVGLLLRTNLEASIWANFLNERNIKTKISSDTLGENPIYKVIFACLNFVERSSIENAIECSKALYECGIYDDYFEFQDMAQKIEGSILNSDLDDFPIVWDLKEFVSDTKKDIVRLALKIGEYYFSNTLQKANISLVTGIIDDVFKKEKSSNLALQKLERMKNNRRETKKFFEIEKNNKGVVEVMTIHKSKGDEFDYVFIPKMSKENYPLETDFKLIKKDETMFMESVKKYPKKEIDIKKEITEENYRLLYVGITRARKRIYLTTPKKYKFFGKLKDFAPCKFIEEVLNG